MIGIKTIIMLVIGAVIAVVLVPSVWDAVYTDARSCIKWNTTDQSAGKDAWGASCSGRATCCMVGINGTSWTILTLVPMLFVALVVIAGVLLAAGYKIPGT